MCWKFDFHHNLVLLCQWLIWKIKFYLKFMRNFRNLSFRSSLPEALCKKGVLRNFTKLTGKHLCQRLFFNKAAGLRPATLLKKRLWHRCFLANFAKFLRIPFFKKHLRSLLLFALEFLWWNFERSRSSRSKIFFKLGVLKYFAIFTRKYLCRSLSLIKLQVFKPVTLIKKDPNTGLFLWILRNF